MTSIKTKTIASAVALAVVQFAVPSSVLAQDEVRQQHVEYGDLNLRTAAGIETLDGRIDRAIGRVCRAHGATTLRELMNEKQCEREAELGVAEQREFAINQANGTVELAEAGADRNQQTRIRLAAAD